MTSSHNNRDPHMPPPEVCDWLLAQEWSGVIPTAITAFPDGGPGGIAAHTAYNHIYAKSALGTDETFGIELPAEALEVLIEDAVARLESTELKRRELASDELARKDELTRKAIREQNGVDETEEEGLDPEKDLLRRILAEAEKSDLSAMSAIGVLTTAAIMMTSQCYDLTKLGDDRATCYQV
jgi:hypothetical protein